jgi:HAMP domain-containing protein
MDNRGCIGQHSAGFGPGAPPMKLLTKFSLIFLAVFGVGLVVAGYLSYVLIQDNARRQVQDQARIMMETAAAMRRYTQDQVKPALEDTVSPDKTFHREIVPAFAATSLFNFLRDRYPEFSYKEAALNPTNPRDRAVYWEEDIINYFRNHPDQTNFDGERVTATGHSLYLARPLRADKSCLECHSTPDAAPPAMIEAYGRANGFGWREHDVIAAQIVSVPLAVPVEMANREFRHLMASLVAVGVVTLVVLNLVLVVTVIRPMGRLAGSAEQISKGELDVPELPVRGKDEISVLAAAFNRMHRSLVAAMKLLDKD